MLRDYKRSPFYSGSLESSSDVPVRPYEYEEEVELTSLPSESDVASIQRERLEEYIDFLYRNRVIVHCWSGRGSGYRKSFGHISVEIPSEKRYYGIGIERNLSTGGEVKSKLYSDYWEDWNSMGKKSDDEAIVLFHLCIPKIIEEGDKIRTEFDENGGSLTYSKLIFPRTRSLIDERMDMTVLEKTQNCSMLVRGLLECGEIDSIFGMRDKWAFRFKVLILVALIALLASGDFFGYSSTEFQTISLVEIAAFFIYFVLQILLKNGHKCDLCCRFLCGSGWVNTKPDAMRNFCKEASSGELREAYDLIMRCVTPVDRTSAPRFLGRLAEMLQSRFRYCLGAFLLSVTAMFLGKAIMKGSFSDIASLEYVQIFLVSPFLCLPTLGVVLTMERTHDVFGFLRYESAVKRIEQGFVFEPLKQVRKEFLLWGVGGTPSSFWLWIGWLFRLFAHQVILLFFELLFLRVFSESGRFAFFPDTCLGLCVSFFLSFLVFFLRESTSVCKEQNDLPVRTVEHKNNPIDFAVAKGYEYRHVVDFLSRIPLLLKTSDVNALLLFAASCGLKDTVSAALAERADIEVADPSSGHTPLSIAVTNGCFSVVELLVERRAQIDKRSYNNNTALELARERGDDDIVNFLQKKEAELPEECKELNDSKSSSSRARSIEMMSVASHRQRAFSS